MIRPPPGSTRTYTLLPYTTRCRAAAPLRADTPNGPAAGPDRNAGTAIRTLSFARTGVTRPGAIPVSVAASAMPTTPKVVVGLISVPFQPPSGELGRAS